MNFDREMQRALEADGEKLRQLTGEDQGPEFWFDCDVCGGEGHILETIHVYEAGCGFSHPDVYSKPCTVCNGTGGYISEADGDDICAVTEGQRGDPA